MRLKLIFFSLFLIPSLVFSSITPKPANIPPPTPVVPDPMKLSPSWWEYFNVDDDELYKHIKKTQEALEKIKSSLSDEEDIQAISLIKHISIRLESLPEIKTPLSSISPPQKEFAESYTLPTLVDLGKKLRENQENMRSLSNQLHLLRNNIKSQVTFFDNLLAHYLASSEKTPERLPMGLEVILTKLELVLDQHRFLLLQRQIEKQKNQLDVIKQEAKFARMHLKPSKEGLAPIEEEISKTEKRASLAQTEAFRAVSNLNQKLDTQQFSQLERDIATQNVHRANISAAIATTAMINAKIQKEIFLLASTKSKSDGSQILNKISTWKSELSKIQKDNQEWKNNTKTEMERSLKNLSKATTEAVEERQEQKALILVNESFLGIKKIENELFLSAFLLEQLSQLYQDKYSNVFDRIQAVWINIIVFFKANTKWFSESFFKIGETPITPIGLFKVVLIAVIAYFLAKFVQTMIKRFGEKYSNVEQSAIYTLSRIAYYCIFYIGLFIAITSIGVEFTAFAFVAGAITFWMGFGLIPIVTNFAAGIIVLLDKNIRKGDLVKLESGEKGRIAEMNVRTSILHTEDGQQMIIPNTELVVKKITNRSLYVGAQCLTISFEVDPSANKDAVKELIIKTAKDQSCTSTHREPQLFLKHFDSIALHFELKVWITRKEAKKERDHLYSTYMWAIETVLKENNIPL